MGDVINFPSAKDQWIALKDPPEVMPMNDLKEHDEGMSCWCEPYEEDGVIVHNSMDGREFYERGERKPS